MKKLFLLFFAVFTVLFFQTPNQTLAQTSYVKYDLAYPGILPDNPFYKIKVLRYKLMQVLITDPKQKIDFYLLEADKGILAAAILIDKHEIKLAGETALKAENNYTLITSEVYNLNKEINYNDLIQKLKLASLKHQEVLSSIIVRVPESDKKTFQTVLDFSKRNLLKIESFTKSFKESN